MNKLFIWSVFILILALGSCTKHEEVLVPNNTPPPDSSYPAVVYQNYANRVYISVLGRKPLESELNAGLLILKKNNLSQKNREDFVDQVLGKPEYNGNVYKLSSVALLNGFDTAEITRQKRLYQMLLAQPQNAPFYDVLNYEIGRLNDMQEILPEMNAGNLTLAQLHRRLVNNYFYDQLNMGTENFVVSMFQNFLNRYPTVSELAEGKRMVDGFSGVLFLSVGKSKNDFLDIFFSAPPYFEGIVSDLFVRYLFRKPSSEEMTNHTVKFKTSGDFKILQRDLLTSKEYTGI